MIVHMIGNAHLDPVWLWPWQSGADEALATFAHAVARCDETPEFIYTRGEAWLFSLVEKLDPELFERARELVIEGRWQLVGNQWVQPDCNGPTWDGWHAQLRLGARYFEEKFGLKSRVGYNVDSFGHPATLPDILAAHGLESYCFHRPGPHQVELPAQTFRWRGLGGGEVTAFRIAQSYVTRTDDLYGQIRLALEAADENLAHTMCFYGVGNHGGGPTKGNLDYILAHRDFAPGVELRFSHPQAFFDAIEGQKSALPIVDFELQRTFPGCYSVMADIKREQHRGEQFLAQTGDLMRNFGGDSESETRLENAWRDLAFTQFHDILAGTSASQTWPSVRAMQGRARIESEEITLEITRKWARKHGPKPNFQQIALFNASDTPWRGTVEHEPFLDFDFWGNRWISDLEGRAIPFQRVQPDANILLSNRVIFETEIAPQSAQFLLVRDDAKPSSDFSTDLESSARHLQNSHIRCDVSPTGLKLHDAKNQRFDLGFQLRKDKSDTWTFTQNRFDEAVFAGASEWNWQLEESGPLRAKLRGECEIGRSRLRLWVSLGCKSETVEWRLEVHWNERYALLQMSINGPDAIATRRDGLVGGHIERARDEFEHPFQKWSQFEQIALVSPDIYSVSALENGAQFSLLRAPRMAWGGGDPEVFAGRETFCDQGFHVFEGAISTAATPAHNEAIYRNMVRKPVVFDRYEGLDRPPWGNAPRAELWTGAEQRARRDGQMAHLQDNGARDLLAPPEDGDLPAEIAEVL